MTARAVLEAAPWSAETGEGWSEPGQARDGGELIEAHLNGDRSAFSRLDAIYRPRLLNFLDRMVRDRARAEELVQETFLRVHRHGARFDRTRRFSTWIFTIAGNLARNDLRRRKRSPFIPLDTEPVPGSGQSWADLAEDPAPGPDQRLLDQATLELIERTAGRLSPIHREVFVLREVEDKSYAEIARIVGTDLGTVKSRLNRARRAFGALIRQ